VPISTFPCSSICQGSPRPILLLYLNVVLVPIYPQFLAVVFLSGVTSSYIITLSECGIPTVLVKITSSLVPDADSCANSCTENH
jgi:hypothetical protein